MHHTRENLDRYDLNRGPFRVARAGPRAWMIVTRTGEAERLGYPRRADAAAMCRLLNDPRARRPLRRSP